LLLNYSIANNYYSELFQSYQKQVLMLEAMSSVRAEAEEEFYSFQGLYDLMEEFDTRIREYLKFIARVNKSEREK